TVGSAMSYSCSERFNHKEPRSQNGSVQVVTVKLVSPSLPLLSSSPGNGREEILSLSLCSLWLMCFRSNHEGYEGLRWKNSTALPQTILCFSPCGTPAKFLSMIF